MKTGSSTNELYITAGREQAPDQQALSSEITFWPRKKKQPAKAGCFSLVKSA
jgi:hypothetical protein